MQLTTKGEFYEIHSSMKAKLCFPGMLDKTGPLTLDKDCLYKVSHLLRRVALPFRVKLILGPLPAGLPKDYTDTFLLEKKFQEPLLVTCTLPNNSNHAISCINLNSNLKLSKCTMGFDSENRLFKSQKVQSALAFCHKNVESWYREVQLIPNLKEELYVKNISQIDDAGSEIIPQPTLDQSTTQQKQLITKEVLEKFPKSRKWYRNLKLFGNQQQTIEDNGTNIVEGLDKGKSMERYKDMSKLIEEKFGKKSYNPVKKSASFMFSNKPVDLEESVSSKNKLALLKCQSLDSNLYTETDRRQSKSNISDGSLSYDFQLCILENESGPLIDKNRFKDNSQIKKDIPKQLYKSKPDLIPTLPKEDSSSYVTNRLQSEFHVKTKVQKDRKKSAQFKDNVKLISAQVHIQQDEIPYSPVVDAIHRKSVDHRTGSAENIYAEICENESCQTLDNLCKCRNKKGTTSYCYVKLGSNGDSVSQSDSDEAIYNTLR